MTMRRWGGIAAVSAVAAVAIAYAASDRLPRLRPGGAALLAQPQPLPAIGLPIALPWAPRILCLGDSLTYGSDRWFGVNDPINGARSWRVSTPYPETLARAFGQRATVINLGFPGDRLAAGVRRWRGEHAAALVIIMFGTNDANPRGWAKPAVPIERYRRMLAALARRWQADGATVLIMAPPPNGTAAGERAVAPYRRAARAAAVAANASFVDPATFLGAIATPLQFDGMHLNAAATAAIGAGLFRSITLASPVTKQGIAP